MIATQTIYNAALLAAALNNACLAAIAGGLTDIVASNAATPATINAVIIFLDSFIVSTQNLVNKEFC